MLRTNRLCWIVLASLATATMTGGCPSGQLQTLSAAASGMTKFNEGRWASLTGTEIKAFFDVYKAGGSVEGFENALTIPESVELTQEQADTVAAFLAENNINDADDLQALVNDPGGIVIPEGAVEVFLDAAQ